MLGIVSAAVGCPPAQTTGNLEVITGSDVWFQWPVSEEPLVFNSAQLAAAPLIPIGAEAVQYSDGFSTEGSPTYIVALARDPNEQETTLESIVGPSSPGGFITQMIGPTDIQPGFPANFVSLPDGYGIPFPQVLFDRGPVTLFPLSDADFTESTSVGIVTCAPSSSYDPQTCFAGPLPPGLQGLYVQKLGACAYDLALQDQVVNAITSQVPPQIVAKAHMVGAVSAAESIVDVASFLNRTSLVSPYSGVVALSNTYVVWNIPLATSAAVSLNYTFTFGLTSGIFSTTSRLNAEADSGFQSGSVAGKLEDALPSSISDTLYLAALAQQSRPVPKGGEAAGGACSGSPASSSCYIPCTLPEGFQTPPPLGPGNTDDSSWHNMSYCQTAANILGLGATQGAQKYGVPTDAIDGIAGLFNAVQPGTDLYRNVRCNFYPTYETDAAPVPVCEVVVRAKRLNLLPDAVELVWFDAPDLGHVGSDEYGNEAFATFLVLFGQGSDTTQLCASQDTLTFPFNLGGVPRRFAHGQGQAGGT